MSILRLLAELLHGRIMISRSRLFLCAAGMAGILCTGGWVFISGSFIGVFLGCLTLLFFISRSGTG